MSRHFLKAVTTVLMLILAVGGANAQATRESGPARAGTAPDEPFATSEAEPGSDGFVQSIPCMSFDDDSHYPLAYEETLDLAIKAVNQGRAELEKEARKCFFRMGAALARHLVFEDPNDPEARYWYAAALGLQAAEEGGRTQVRLAQRAHEQARVTLTVAPDHAGAQHVLGRLHAAIMRLSGLKRWIATKILGGKVLSGASWETAESFLAAAARLQPEVPTHHYELGALYLDTNRPELALAAFERAVACAPIHPAGREVHARAEEAVDRLLRGEPEEAAPPRATHSRRGGRRTGGRQ